MRGAWGEELIIKTSMRDLAPIAFMVKQGSKKTLSGRPGQVDCPFGQVTFSPSLPHGQGPRQAVRRLNF